MSSPKTQLKDPWEGYLETNLKASIRGIRPPADLRRRLLWLAAKPIEVLTQPVIPQHLIERALPGSYKDLQHRLAGRAFYTGPFATGMVTLML
jgi:hypothetical protein